MKRFIAYLTVLTLATCLLASESNTTLTQMPEEVTLTTGRVLRRVQVVRWEKNRVVLKYSGGVDPIPFSLFKVPSPTEVAALRDAAKAAQEKVSAPNNRTVVGQVFVTTRGAGAYKFAGAQVRVFPLSALAAIKDSAESEVATAKIRAGVMGRFDPDPIRYAAWQAAVKNLNPVTTTTTDADGMYRLTFTASEPVFIYCATYRAASANGEYNVWAVPVETADRIDLNSSNQF